MLAALREVRLLAALERGAPGGLLDQPISAHDLSAGERQKLGIARLLLWADRRRAAGRPLLVLLDEVSLFYLPLHFVRILLTI